MNEASNVDIQRIEQGQQYTDLEEKGKELIESMLSPADARTVPITQNVMFERPDKQILNYIGTKPPDLVIMGSQRKTGVERITLYNA